MRFILASASPARLAVLRAAGIEPDVIVSGVDEDAVMAELTDPTHAETVTALAAAKARAVAGELDPRGDADGAASGDAVVVGCDSMLSIGDALVGKPHTAEVARKRWADMAGGTGELLTGHAVLRLSGGAVTAEASGTCTTTVRFAEPAQHELDAYIATGEPLQVAGAFTLDALGGWFVEGIDGDPSSVVGISLPLTRRLLGETGVSVVDLWHR
ncbi:Maf family protein [Prauserella alba]|uniref:Nucleoside triphosphate pyrophosphatase n=1 Tax=Prauserella alba TaxID=176898 RepID=A0ABN1VVW1_9PSEU|nr:Maf family protein [Prauserella alba]MCP2183721.1 septum formation protein [Prauserella alba]